MSPQAMQHLPTQTAAPVTRARSCAALLAVPLVLTACAGALPRGRSTDVSAFNSYEAAETALESAAAYRTTLDQLRALGFDVAASSNVERVPFPQWLGMLVPANLPLEQAEGGIRDCAAAKSGCDAYVFRFSSLRSRRTGSFAADFFNFRRVTESRGWRFEAVVLVRGDVVVFRNHLGSRRIETTEERHNPLGPFQPAGESTPRELLLR